MFYITSMIFQAAKAAMVPTWLLLAVCTQESGLNPNLVHHNDGKSASYGLCQIKYETAKSLGYSIKKIDLLNPKTNAVIAASYLSLQINKYGNLCHAVAAYNAGSYNESRYLGIPRNVKYVRKVQKILDKSKKYMLNCR